MKKNKSNAKDVPRRDIFRYMPRFLQQLIVLGAGILFSVPYMIVKLTQQISQIVKNFSLKLFGNVLRPGGIKELYREKRDAFLKNFSGLNVSQVKDLFQIGVGLGLLALSVSAIFQGWGVALIVFLLPELLTAFSSQVLTSLTTLLFGAIGLSGMRKVQRNYEYYMGNNVRVDKTAAKDLVAANVVDVPVASQIVDKEPAPSVDNTSSSTPKNKR